MKTFYFSIILLLLHFTMLSQQTFNVPADYPTIQDALNAATENTNILVGPGTYEENLLWPLNVDGIVLKSTNGPLETIIDGGSIDRVLEINGQSENGLQQISNKTIIDGFTIQNGLVTDYNFDVDHNEGAGMFINDASPQLLNLIVKNNIGEGTYIKGAGAYIRKYSGHIDNCDFISNEINTRARADGPGLHITFLDSCKITNCLFQDNKAESLPLTAYTDSRSVGGGLSLYEQNSSFDAWAIISNCTFSGNSIKADDKTNGAGLVSNCDSLQIDSSIFSNNIMESNDVSTGGGLYIYQSTSFKLSNSIIENNEGKIGSGIGLSLDDDANFLIDKTIIENNSSGYLLDTINASSLFIYRKPNHLVIRNSQINNNEGHPIMMWLGNAALSDGELELTIESTTIANNEKSLKLVTLETEITNSILWNNGIEEIFNNEYIDESESITISNSIVKGGWVGNNVIDSDPLFESMDQLIPTSDSPAIGAGLATNYNYDILGNPRPMPINTNPDIGAYEVNQSIVSNISNIDKPKLDIYPNPTSSIVNFNIEMDVVEIYNQAGKRLALHYDVKKLTLGDFPDGMYFLLTKKDSDTYRKKIVINRSY